MEVEEACNSSVLENFIKNNLKEKCKKIEDPLLLELLRKGDVCNALKRFTMVYGRCEYGITLLTAVAIAVCCKDKEFVRKTLMDSSSYVVISDSTFREDLEKFVFNKVKKLPDSLLLALKNILILSLKNR